MADVQAENGYTKIANDLVSQFCRLNLSGAEWRVMWSIFRRTYGWNKAVDTISVSQIMEDTNLPERTARHALRKLVRMDVVTVEGAGSAVKAYGVQKDYECWNEPNFSPAPRREGCKNQQVQKFAGAKSDRVQNFAGGVSVEGVQNFAPTKDIVKDITPPYNPPPGGEAAGSNPDRFRFLASKFRRYFPSQKQGPIERAIERMAKEYAAYSLSEVEDRIEAHHAAGTKELAPWELFTREPGSSQIAVARTAEDNLPTAAEIKRMREEEMAANLL